MCTALIGPNDVAFGQAGRLIRRIGQEEGTQPRRQVDDDIHTGIPDTVDGFLEQLRAATAFARLGVANVNVHAGGPRPRRLAARRSDFRRGNREGGVFAVERSVSGHSAGEAYLSISWVHTYVLAFTFLPKSPRPSGRSSHAWIGRRSSRETRP